MTDFIRNILVTAAAANASSAAAAAAPTPAPVPAPVNQIQIPPPTATPAVVAPSVTAAAAAVEKQRLIKVEVPEPSAPAMATASADAGKAQRAARRDVVNARRDKRKAMASPPTPSSPAGLTSGADSSSTDSEDDAATATMATGDDAAANASSKKMKTSATSSVAVAGGLAASETTTAQTATTAPATSTAPVKKSSFSSSMPPTPGLLFTPEIDAAGEERLRAMEAQLETLDPDSKEAKKKRRLIRNRMSAQLHRERKKAYVGQLEDQLLEKDRELKLLQEKLAKLMAESEKPTMTATAATATTATATPAVETKPVVATTPATTTPAAAAKPATVAAKPKAEDDVAIKEEPQAWDAPSWALDTTDSWDLHGLEDSEMAELETADLLRDFDDPFAGLGGAAYPELGKPHHEIHAAKKNLAMMAAVMFSVSFFGNSPAFYNVTPGSNFSSTFSAHPPKDLSQMSIASRIVACLEKTSWKEFRSVSSWISQAATAAAAASSEETDEPEDRPRAVASPSAASDVTDSAGSSCGSPARSVLDDALDVAMMGETDLIDEFEYPVEDPFGADAAASADWLDDVEKELPKQDDEAASFLSDVMLHEPVVPKQEPVESKTVKTTLPAASETKSLTSRLYESLTALWREKNQVLLTVRDDKQQVLQRSVADMSSIRDGLQSGNFFTKVFGGDDAASQAAAASEDTSVTFLYPMSAFASDPRPFSRAAADGEDADPVFLEVSCQLNGGGAAAPAAAMPAMM